MSNKDFANNMASVNAVTTTIKNNIFYNTYRVQKIAGNTTKAISDNYLYSDGGENVGSLDNTDKTYGTEENPQFVGPVNQDPDKLILFRLVAQRLMRIELVIPVGLNKSEKL